LAEGASPDNVLETIRSSDRYRFIQANLLDMPQIQQILSENQVCFLTILLVFR
jgi:dTDP-D-glucose 4,6-dehydratase